MESNLQETKNLLIEALKEKQENGILEESNVKLLEKLINNAETIKEAEAIAGLGTIYKRTGFHFDHRLETDGSDIKYFVKNKELSFVTDKNAKTHKLIIGDNYDALLNLLITHKGMIDVIYIDPPYGKDSMGAFANTNYNNAITRDNLLSMLEPRLQIAKLLLSKTGLIFISIDDLNAAYLKCLMDELFGELNFVGQAPRKTCEIIRQNADDVCQRIYDYVLIYKNSETKINKKIVGEKEFPLNDGIDDYYLSDFQNSGDNGTRAARPNLYYSIYVNNDGTLTLDKKDENSLEILPRKVKGEDGRWLWQPSTFIEKNKLLTYVDGTIKIKRYKTTELEKNPDLNKYQSEKLWLDTYKNAMGSSLLSSILPNNKFSYPKPMELIKFLIQLHPNKNCIVLDFFAGSGTTGQAVLDLNKEDNGNRQFILCTNNEKDDNFIAETTTTKRLKRIMCGKCYDGSKNFKWIEKNEPYGDNLDVLEISAVGNSIQEKGKTPFDVIDETLYGLPKFDSIEEKISWVCRNFDVTQKNIESDDEWFKRTQKGE